MEERILLLALRGRDSQVLEQLLVKAGNTCFICQDSDQLAEELRNGAGAILITEESIHQGDQNSLTAWLTAQEPWSDLPVVLLATKRAGRRTEQAQQMLDRLGSVVVLERPLHGETVVSAVNSALRGRRRQYIARQHLEDLRTAEQRLTQLNALLEERIHHRTAELDRLWALSEDMLARGNYRGTFSAVSPAWTRVLGHVEQQLLKRPQSDLIHPEDVAKVAAALHSMRQTRQPARFENRMLTADGSWKPIGWTLFPEPDDIHFIAIGRDLSIERARQLELEESQNQLRQAQKMEAVGQLTGGIAHDFNNLLQGIMGSLEMVQIRIRQGRTEGLERFIVGAMTSANRAAALTHRLLAFSRRQPLDPKPVEANPLVASMEDLLLRTLGENIELNLVLAPNHWLALCDANQLESAILNLAINARDAMPDGGRLTIETSNSYLKGQLISGASYVQPGHYVCISVTDTGVGMPQDVVERAFDPFFTTKPIGQGTGLGLSMIYGFARQSEGHVRIQSEVGKGTSIKLYLPRHDGEPSHEDSTIGSSQGQLAHHGEVVMVIDDEPVVRGLIVEVLHELGYQAIEAEDGAAGIALLKSAPRVDLLVTDIGLPGLNGRQVADAARLHRPGLKVLFMTGYAESAAAAGGFLESGMSLMTKPFPMDIFAQRIRAIIEGAPV